MPSWEVLLNLSTGLGLLVLIANLTTSVGFFWILGWKIGAVEAIGITILVGLSVDYLFHVAAAFAHSPKVLDADHRNWPATTAPVRP